MLAMTTVTLTTVVMSGRTGSSTWATEITLHAVARHLTRTRTADKAVHCPNEAAETTSAEAVGMTETETRVVSMTMRISGLGGQTRLVAEVGHREAKATEEASEAEAEAEATESSLKRTSTERLS